MAEHLILRLEAPLQAWGDVALDPRRPTRTFPSRSALAGLLANALGWRYRDAEHITALQDSLRYAVREDRPPVLLRDFQTADLERETTGWTRWGMESRAKGLGTHILEKYYLADGAFTVALALSDASGSLAGREVPALDEMEAALRRPARPLFLGRKGCPPATPLLGRPGASRVETPTPVDALLRVPLATGDRQDWERRAGRRLRLWYDPADGVPGGLEEPQEVQDVWDRRDFHSNRFGGARQVALVLVPHGRFPVGAAGRSAA
jgi:CRISPR system Cascade subunit CasD